jgi:hypothetical protein
MNEVKKKIPLHYILKTHLGTAVAVKANIGTSGRRLLKDESLR